MTGPARSAVLAGDRRRFQGPGVTGFRHSIGIGRPTAETDVLDLTEELIRRGHSDPNIRLVLGGNFRRRLGTTWE